MLFFERVERSHLVIRAVLFFFFNKQGKKKEVLQCNICNLCIRIFWQFYFLNSHVTLEALFLERDPVSLLHLFFSLKTLILRAEKELHLISHRDYQSIQHQL